VLLHRYKTYETFVPKNTNRLDKFLTGYLTLAFNRFPFIFWTKDAKSEEEAVSMVKHSAIKDARIKEEILSPETKYFHFPVTSMYFTLYWNNGDCVVHFYDDFTDYVSKSPDREAKDIEFNGKVYKNHLSADMLDVKPA
jgi:hypothetical protein